MFLENRFPADPKVRHREDCIDYLQQCMDLSGASQMMGVINISYSTQQSDSQTKELFMNDSNDKDRTCLVK